MTRKGPGLRPEGAPKLGETFTDWRDFTNRVCRPWVEDDGEHPKDDAWYQALVISMDPYYLAVSLVIADNTIRRVEATAREAMGECGTSSTTHHKLREIVPDWREGQKEGGGESDG